MQQNLYELFEVANTASLAVIEAAYQVKLKQYAGKAEAGNEEAQIRIKVLNAAYEVLSNADQRALYDQRFAQRNHARNRSADPAANAPPPQPRHRLGASNNASSGTVRRSRFPPELDISLPLSKQALGLVGSLVLLIGVFTPIVSMPIIGSMNYFHNGRGDGVIVLILACISLYFSVVKSFRWLWWTGCGAAALLLFTFVRIHYAIGEIPSSGLGNLAAQAVQVQWGWIVLVVGAGMLILASAAKSPDSE